MEKRSNTIHANAEKYSQFARQNVEQFINWCRGLDCHQRFESNDLVDQKSDQKEINERRHKCAVVCLCQIKQKYDRALRSKKEAKVSKGEEAIRCFYRGSRVSCHCGDNTLFLLFQL